MPDISDNQLAERFELVGSSVLKQKGASAFHPGTWTLDEDNPIDGSMRGALYWEPEGDADVLKAIRQNADGALERSIVLPARPIALATMPSSVSALNALMAAVEAIHGERAGGMAITLPAGEFVIDASLELANHVTLQGQGAGTVIRAASGMTGAMVTNAHNADRRFALRHLTLWGDDEEVTGISFNTPTASPQEYADGMWKIENVMIADCGVDGIVVAGRGEGKGQSIELRDIGRYGIDINSVDNDFISVTIGNSGSAGVRIQQSNNRLENTKVYYCGYTDDTAPHGFWLDGGQGAVIATLTNCEAQDCTGHGFYVEGFDHADLNACVADSNGAGHNDLTFTGHGFVFHNSDYGMLRGRARDRNANTTRQQRGLLLSGWTSIMSVDLMASGNEAGNTSNTTGNTISGRVNGTVGNIS